jgi:hypothetical protein
LADGSVSFGGGGDGAVELGEEALSDDAVMGSSGTFGKGGGGGAKGVNWDGVGTVAKEEDTALEGVLEFLRVCKVVKDAGGVSFGCGGGVNGSTHRLVVADVHANHLDTAKAAKAVVRRARHLSRHKGEVRVRRARVDKALGGNTFEAAADAAVMAEGLHGSARFTAVCRMEDVHIVAVGGEEHIGVGELGESKAAVDGYVEQEGSKRAALPAPLGRVHYNAVDAELTITAREHKRAMLFIPEGGGGDEASKRRMV